MAGTVRLNSASCGAPLEVTDAVRFVTCAQCGTTLSVVASGGAVWAEVREIAQGVVKIADNTGKAADATERVAAELELKRLEEEMQKARAAHAGWLAAMPGAISIARGVPTMLFGCQWPGLEAAQRLGSMGLVGSGVVSARVADVGGQEDPDEAT